MKQERKYVKTSVFYALVMAFLISGCSIGISAPGVMKTEVGVQSDIEQSSLVEKEETDKASLRMAEQRKVEERKAEAARVALIQQQETQEAERVAQEKAKVAQEAERVAQEQAKAVQEKKVATPTPLGDPYQWIQDAQRQYGVYADPDTRFIVSDAGNCGGPRGGCTNQWSTFTGPITTHISPSGIGDYQLLFHEIAHTRGIIDECAADRWAHNVTGVVIWKYAGCAR